MKCTLIIIGANPTCTISPVHNRKNNFIYERNNNPLVYNYTKYGAQVCITYGLISDPEDLYGKHYDCIALSEAKYIALSNTAKELVWLRQLTSELGSVTN